MITELALAAKSEICEKALDMFVSAYGAEAGNLALKVLSVGGLYVGGGIAPRILEKLKDGTFMKAFTDKGRLSQLLINMPVRIILESRAALLGAAAYAEARAAENQRHLRPRRLHQSLTKPSLQQGGQPNPACLVICKCSGRIAVLKGHGFSP